MLVSSNVGHWFTINEAAEKKETNPKTILYAISQGSLKATMHGLHWSIQGRHLDKWTPERRGPKLKKRKKAVKRA